MAKDFHNSFASFVPNLGISTAYSYLMAYYIYICKYSRPWLYNVDLTDDQVKN